MAQADLEVTSLRNREAQGDTPSSGLESPVNTESFHGGCECLGDSTCSGGKAQEAVEHTGPESRQWRCLELFFLDISAA